MSKIIYLYFFNCQTAKFDYGKKAENPIDYMYFYTKENPDEASRVNKHQVWLVLLQQHYSQFRGLGVTDAAFSIYGKADTSFLQERRKRVP